MNTRNLPRMAAVAVATFVAALMFPSVGYAQLPNFLPAPVIAFDSGGKTHYDAAQQLLSVDASALNVLLPGQPPANIVTATGTTGSLGCLPIPPSITPRCDFGSFTIRARVNNSGVLVGGVAGPELTIVGKVVDLFGTTVADGVLVTGDLKELFIGADKFELRFSITGGLLKDSLSFNQCGDFGTTLCEIGTSVGITLPAGSLLTPFTGSFAGNFDGGAFGSAGAIQPMGFLDPSFDLCTGQIGGLVQNTATLGGIDGVAMTLTGGVLSEAGKINTGVDGSYLFLNLCFGNYQVEASTPQWYAPSGATTTPVTLATGQKNLTTNFLFTSTAVQGSYTTFTQGGWGAKPKGDNPGQLLATNFGILYPNPDGELVVGIPNTIGRYTITLTGASAVQTFLPQGGKPSALNRDYVDPPSIWKLKHRGKTQHHRMISELAGNVVALQLNVDFSAASLTRFGLGGLHLAKGKLAGQTVNQVLALGNNVLGGAVSMLPVGLTISELNEIIESINGNYQAGTKDKLYLQP